MDSPPATSEPSADAHRAQLQRLIAAVTAFVGIADYLQVDTPHSWRTDAGMALVQQPDLVLQAQGCALLLDDLLHEPSTCIAIVERLSAALQALTTGPGPDAV